MLLAINADKDATESIEIPAAAQRYTLTAASLSDSTIALNGRQMKLGPDDALPNMSGDAVPVGKIELAPESITFLAFPSAENASCR